MPEPVLLVDLRKAGDIAILDLSGKITMGEGTVRLRWEVRRLLSEGWNKILLNFEHVKSVDLSGVGEIKLCINHAEKEGGEMKGEFAVNIKDVGELTGLVSTIDCFRSEAEALCSFSVK